MIAMKHHTEYLTLNVPTGSYTNLSRRVQDAIDKSGVREGIVLVNATVFFENPVAEFGRCDIHALETTNKLRHIAEIANEGVNILDGFHHRDRCGPGWLLRRGGLFGLQGRPDFVHQDGGA